MWETGWFNANGDENSGLGRILVCKICTEITNYTEVPNNLLIFYTTLQIMLVGWDQKHIKAAKPILGHGLISRFCSWELKFQTPEISVWHQMKLFDNYISTYVHYFIHFIHINIYV